jgi:hypothetical protein
VTSKNPPAATDAQRDADYLKLMLAPLRKCETYQPAFGKGADEKVSLPQFKAMYSADPLYQWVGLDSDLMYAAHKAAGGLTSIYRQLGTGCERLMRAIIRHELALDEQQAKWSYEYVNAAKKTATHTLDARIDLRHVADRAARARVTDWLASTGKSLGLSTDRIKELKGTVLEVRQGYKSADSKRQFADLRYGNRAKDEDYLPVIAIVSTQVSEPVCRRYRNAQILVLLGRTDTDQESTFGFFRTVVGYDLAGFFRRNSPALRTAFEKVLEKLLSP